jgi:pimeloyl-ACP methyl ester carboxylesterase
MLGQGRRSECPRGLLEDRSIHRVGTAAGGFVARDYALSFPKRLRSLVGPSASATFRNRVTFALLEAISVPTLLITGDADMYAPPPVMRMFAARVKGSQAVVIPEAGHSAYWEQPEIFSRTVLEFIARH